MLYCHSRWRSSLNRQLFLSNGEFTAIGVWGQSINIDPIRDLIIVKTSSVLDFDGRDHESVAAFCAIARSVAGNSSP